MTMDDATDLDLAVLVILLSLVLLWFLNTFVVVIIYRKVVQLARASARDEDSFDEASRPTTPLPLLDEDEESKNDSIPVAMLSNNYIRRSLLLSDQSSSSPDIAAANVYDEITNVLVPKRMFANYRQGSKKRKRLAASNSTGAANSRGTSSKVSNTSTIQTLSCPSQTISELTRSLENSANKDQAEGNHHPSFTTFKPKATTETIAETTSDGDDTRLTYMNMERLSTCDEHAAQEKEADYNNAEYVPMGSISRMPNKVPLRAPKPPADKVDEILTARLSRMDDSVRNLAIRKNESSASPNKRGVATNTIVTALSTMAADTDTNSPLAASAAMLSSGLICTSPVRHNAQTNNDQDCTATELELSDIQGQDCTVNATEAGLQTSVTDEDSSIFLTIASEPGSALVMSQDIKDTKESIERILDQQCAIMPCASEPHQEDSITFQD